MSGWQFHLQLQKSEIKKMNPNGESSTSDKTFNDFLKEMGCYESITLQALIEMLDESIDELTEKSDVDKSEVANQLRKILLKV